MMSMRWLKYMVLAFVVLVAMTQAEETSEGASEASSNQPLDVLLEYLPDTEEIKKYWDSRTKYVDILMKCGNLKSFCIISTCNTSRL